MTVLRSADALHGFVADIRDWSALRLEQITLDDCAHWHLHEGALHHDTGRFFSLRGMAGFMPQPDGTRGDAAMIDQPEIGWLGFLVRPSDRGVDWLVQAKTEPGNVGQTHLAPSIQATRSNYRQAHGGRPTAFLDLFQNSDSFLSDAPHSEQGSRFLWKFNRNSTLAIAAEDAPDLTDLRQWAWCSSAAMRAVLGHDLIVNTDARSVIATAPWALLSDGGAMFRSATLAQSYLRQIPVHEFDRILRRIAPQHAKNTNRWQQKDLTQLTSHHWSRDGLTDAAGDPVAGYFDVSVTGREVDRWCQPFLMQRTHSAHHLLMRTGAQGAEVFVRLYDEPGFGPRREYGPSLHSLYTTPAQMQGWGAQTDLIVVQQSDEGGRFMQARASYAISLIADAPQQPRWPFGEWVSLATLERMCAHPGTTTNELRTLTSVLLSADFDTACMAL